MAVLIMARAVRLDMSDPCRAPRLAGGGVLREDSIRRAGRALSGIRARPRLPGWKPGYYLDSSGYFRQKKASARLSHCLCELCVYEMLALLLPAGRVEQAEGALGKAK